MKPNCPLCSEISNPFYQWKGRVYHQCTNCLSVFLDPSLYPDHNSEKSRYLEHNNDSNDQKYRNFVSPITKSILSTFSKYNLGLDFGSGTDSAVSKVLIENQFQIKSYDPFFHDDKLVLEERFDYIACCEVIEHFHNPLKEFQLLKSLLLPNGKLFCMTNLYHENIDFHNWYYKNDKTHVFFYHKNSIAWIQNQIGFKGYEIANMLITFSN
jgi:SAM-dependent methyltransferase